MELGPSTRRTPEDKLERERLRVMLEGKRVTVKGKTYRVAGLVEKLGGERIAPWTYLDMPTASGKTSSFAMMFYSFFIQVYSCPVYAVCYRDVVFGPVYS